MTGATKGFCLLYQSWKKCVITPSCGGGGGCGPTRFVDFAVTSNRPGHRTSWGLGAGAGAYRTLQVQNTAGGLTAGKLAIAQATERAGAGAGAYKMLQGCWPKVSPILRLRPGGWGRGPWGRSQLLSLKIKLSLLEDQVT